MKGNRVFRLELADADLLVSEDNEGRENDTYAERYYPTGKFVAAS